MALFAQHGHGKSDKINRGIEAGFLDGVIMSPRDEIPSGLINYVNDLRSHFSELPILFDPQFYATTVTPAKDGKLPDYPYYHGGLTRGNFISSNDIGRYVQETLDYQMRLPLSNLISPTVLFDDFQDPWSQIALSMAQESINYYSTLSGASPLLLSLVFSETALRSPDRMGEFLDMVSSFRTTGFYIILRRANEQYMTQMDPNVLESLLYLIYVLSELNNYEVVVGYADIIGILLHAVGVKVTACGWYSRLRQFSLARFQPSTGGRAPRDRYTSIPLLNSVLVIPELDSIYRSGLINEVLTGTSHDGMLRTDPANASWTKDISCLHHWEAIHQTINSVAQGVINQRLALMLTLIGRAKAIYARLAQNGVLFEQHSGPGHLDQWQRSIQNFKNSAGIQ